MTLALPGTVLAQGENPVSLTASAGFDGYCREGRWIPVRVRIENQGAGIQGQVEVQVAGVNNREDIYARVVTLPTVSHKEFTLYIYPEGYMSSLTLRLVSDGKEIQQAVVPLTCVTGADALYGVLAESTSPFNVLSEIDPPAGSARVAKLELQDLPDKAQGLDALQVLVIADVDTGQLSPEQIGALAGWIAGGGKLVVAGGPEWRKTTAGLLDLLPLQPQEIHSLQLTDSPGSSADGAEGLSGLSGELLLSTGPLDEGASLLLAQSGVTLAASRKTGYGEAIFLAFDPSLEPVRSWDGLPELYRQILVPIQKPAWASGFQDWSLAANAAASLPNLSLPSAWWIAGFMGLYVIAIGPVNFILLRRFKKRELAWLSIPLLVIVFSSLAFLAGRGLSGRRPVLNRLAVVQSWPGSGRAEVDGLVGVFSPDRQVYSLEISPQFLAHAIPADLTPSEAGRLRFTRTETDSTLLPDLRVDVGEVRSLAVEGQVAAYPLSQDLSLQIDEHGAVLKGSITNGGNQVLHGAVLLAPGNSQQFGDLAPGQKQEIGLSLDATSRSPYAGGMVTRPGPVQVGPGGTIWDVLLGTTDYFRDRQTYQHYALLSALTGYMPLGTGQEGFTFAAWSDSSPIAAELSPGTALTSDTTLYLVSAQPEISTSGGKLSLPPGLFSWSILTPGSMGEASPYETVLNPGGFSLRFTPLIPLRERKISSLTLRLKSYGASGPAGVEVQLWNFIKEEWDGLPGPNWGDNSVPAPQSYLGPDGEIRLRLDNSDQIGPVQIESADFVLEIEE